MTRQTNARSPASRPLLHCHGLPRDGLFERAARADGIARELAPIAAHASDVPSRRVAPGGSCVVALVLAVGCTGHARRGSRPGAAGFQLPRRRGSSRGDSRARDTRAALARDRGSREAADDAVSAQALAGFLLKVRVGGTTISATFFAVGSTPLLLAPPPRSRGSRPAGVARNRRLRPARRGLPRAAHRIPGRADRPLHLASHAGFRSGARAVAPLQGCRRAPRDQPARPTELELREMTRKSTAAPAFAGATFNASNAKTR